MPVAKRVSLDDEAAFKSQDPSDLLSRILELPVQFEVAWHQASRFSLPRTYRYADRVVFLGMGGSAIGADAVRVLIDEASIKVSAEVIRDYEVPAAVGKRTLVVASSFSGDTEETLSAVSAAHTRGARILAVTGGGHLGAFAAEHGIPTYVIEYPSPEPRSAFAHTFTPLLVFMQRLGYLPDQTLAFEEGAGIARRLVAQIGPDADEAGNQAKQLARFLLEKLPLIVASGPLAVAADRWRTQLNENAKVWALTGAIPELDHNMVVGLGGPEAVRKLVRVVTLRSDSEHPRNQARHKVTQTLLDREKIPHQSVALPGTGSLSQLMSAVVIGDLVSYYLAMLRQIDPAPVESIDYLKAELAGG